MSIAAISMPAEFMAPMQQLEERRANDRHQAIYRPCCLFLDGHASVGLVRNFSKGGARIDTDADLKVGDEITYFWDAQTRIAATVIWRDGRAAGVEHTNQVTVPERVYPMRSVRVPCEAEAFCWVKGQLHTALVENVSIGGMRLRGLPPVEPGTLLTVELCGFEFSSVAVRWYKDQRAGLRFANRLSRNELTQLLSNDEVGLSGIEFAGENQ